VKGGPNLLFRSGRRERKVTGPPEKYSLICEEERKKKGKLSLEGFGLAIGKGG